MQTVQIDQLDAILAQIDPSYEMSGEQRARLGNRFGANIILAQFDGEETIFRYGHNARTSAGAAFVTNHQFNAAATPLNYIALSSATLTPAAGDTSLVSEITTTGLARKIATFGNYIAPASLGGAASCDLTASFVNNGGSAVSVNSIGLFSAASAGTLAFEANLVAGNTLNPGDSVLIKYTIQT